MSDKLQILKKIMQDKGYDFYLVPSVDDHNNEYVPNCWQYRAWISQFDGSAGDVLIGLDRCFLSTDGRYFSQAEYQLDSKEFSLLKQTGYGSEIEKWLAENLADKTIAVDPSKITINRALGLQKIANETGGKIVFDLDNPVAKAQQELGESISVPNEKVFIQEIQYAGQSTQSKLNSIRNNLKEKSQNALVVSNLDGVMWTLNIRGRDIKHTPVSISYLIVTLTGAYLYIDDSKLDDEVKKYLDENKIIVKEYSLFYQDLEQYEAKYLLDIKNANYAMKQAIDKNNESSILIDDSPITLSKALKNSIEINGAQDAHKKDAAAYIKWWHWLENNYQGLDEIQAAAKLTEFRSQQKGYIEDSFPYIVGHAANGAIIHYMAKNNSQLKTIDDQAPLLCDSGAQYNDGTTDVTRVFHFGKPTKEHRRYYTLVLKGHLALGRAVFPKGTTGSQLDVLAREHLWHFCANYNHGTGHGVGSCLGVHEGPQGISPNSAVPLMPGMVLSNEPGAYFPGDFGIRIENLCHVKQRDQESQTGHGPFYYFESLTLIPYEYKLIETWMLTYTEKKTINNYYSRIRKEILPLIEEQDIKDFLLFKTRHIR